MMFDFFICAMKHYRRLDILCKSVEGHMTSCKHYTRTRIFYQTSNMQILQAILYWACITDEEAAGAGKSLETDCTVVAVGGGEAEESDINSSDHEAQISQLLWTVR